jgi:uncharacterized protein DUF3943
MEIGTSATMRKRPAARFRTALLGVAVTLGATAACAAFAAEPELGRLPELWAALQNDPAEPIPGEPKPDFSADIEARKSYIIPALEIVGFDVLLNLANRYSTSKDYHSNFSSIRRNLHHSWVVDNDPFSTNQFGHPYQGSMYHGFARSAGLNFWESAAYTFAGSAFWEIAGETTPPSRNDQIASGVAGSFLGEALFRMANLLLERGDAVPALWREVGAAVISPPVGFNRLAFGDRLRNIFPSHDPVYYSRLGLGVSATTQNEPGASSQVKRNEAQVDFSMDYGLPGKPGYTYKRPFDYFTAQVTASSANGFENILTRGLLYGTDYGFGANYRGVWGLYGSYDYIAPQVFRVSSTALSLGTTGQWWMSDAIALQGSALLGTGYAGVGTLHGSSATDYHYGVAPQALVALRLIYGDTASLDFLGREYFVSGIASASTGGHDNIVRADTVFTVRIYRQHAVALKYVWSRRNATFPDLGNTSQTRGTIGIFYTYLGHDRFGAVEWR